MNKIVRAQWEVFAEIYRFISSRIPPGTPSERRSSAQKIAHYAICGLQPKRKLRL